MKALSMIALLAAITLIVPSTPTDRPALNAADQAVVRVDCTRGSGSAVRTASGYVSVKHVTGQDGCKIAGQPITLKYTSKVLDFSVIANPSKGPKLVIDCGGFQTGRLYWAVGHARGNEENLGIPLVWTGETDDSGQAQLLGLATVIPGQSGGAIIDDETGKLVGTINTYDYADGLSGSVPLASTPLCRKAR